MSILDKLEPIYSKLPEVKSPEKEVPLKKRLIWTAAVLVIFFVMGATPIIGVSQQYLGELRQLQVIIASKIGTLITLGIGPIVSASIILQLLVGAKILNIDLSNPTDRARFQGLQKLFSILFCFFEALPFTFRLQPSPGMFLAVALQIALGSIILIYLDEVVSKYGVGSGIGLFIAGGVAGAFFWQVFAPPLNLATHPELAQGGLLASFIYSVAIGSPRFLILMPILIAIILFLLITFAEGIHVNIPLSIGRKGFGGRFPVKLLYVSNLPVIFSSVLFVNIKMFASALERISAGTFIAGFFKLVENSVTPPYNLFYTIIEKIGAEGINALPFLAPQLLHATIFMILLIITCVIFGVFWVQFAGQGPEAIAEQLQSSGMYIPGFRRDKRIIQKILEKYIPSITILGSVLVALLAGFGDMTLGTLATGTGILLTVGIVYRMYEELAKAQLMEMHPLLSKLLGGK